MSDYVLQLLGLFISKFVLQTKRTLRKLYNDHTKAAKDLQGRVEKLKSEGKDPSIPQLLIAEPKYSIHVYDTPNAASSSSAGYHRAGSSSNAVDDSYLALSQHVCCFLLW